MVIDGLRADLLNVRLLFSHLIVDLLDLVLQDLQLSLLVLELLRVDVNFALQTFTFTLVYRVVT